MAIKQYSLAKDGAKQLSPAFKVREFRCRDGSDAIMIDQTLVVLLQAIREHFGKAVTITSGYTARPPTTPLWVVLRAASTCWAGRQTSRWPTPPWRMWPPTPRA